jgi:hypothetical protein
MTISKPITPKSMACFNHSMLILLFTQMDLNGIGGSPVVKHLQQLQTG